MIDTALICWLQGCQGPSPVLLALHRPSSRSRTRAGQNRDALTSPSSVWQRELPAESNSDGNSVVYKKQPRQACSSSARECRLGAKSNPSRRPFTVCSSRAGCFFYQILQCSLASSTSTRQRHPAAAPSPSGDMPCRRRPRSRRVGRRWTRSFVT